MRSSLVKPMASTLHQYVVDFTGKWGNLHVRFNSSLSLGTLHLRSWKSERIICHHLPLASASKRISPHCGLIFADVCVPSYNRHSCQSEPSRYSARGKELFVTFHARLSSCTRAQTQRRTPRTPAHGAKPEPCPTGRSCHRGSRLTHGFRMFTHLEPLSLPAPCCLPQAEYPLHKPLDITVV